MKRIALAVAVALLLAGCGGQYTGSAGTSPASSADPLGQIATFAVADLQAAEAEAVAQGDAIAQPCYPALIQFVQSLQSQAGSLTAGTSIKGGFSGFQAARGLRIKVQAQVAGGLSLKSVVPDYLKLGCSALVLDEQTFLLRLAALAGGAAATAGVGPAALGVLPAIGGALPIPIAP